MLIAKHFNQRPSIPIFSIMVNILQRKKVKISSLHADISVNGYALWLLNFVNIGISYGIIENW